ncbi:hypothetical protein Scep_028049 [Stephania cephalantha]|uniref:Uncharacterized protein n=1 Tax=Stephania cephalantha TaxID=152367 RepID=A0AAP0EDS0_9MAGN
MERSAEQLLKNPPPPIPEDEDRVTKKVRNKEPESIFAPPTSPLPPPSFKDTMIKDGGDKNANKEWSDFSIENSDAKRVYLGSLGKELTAMQEDTKNADPNIFQDASDMEVHTEGKDRRGEENPTNVAA